jgi:signal transduction histidine kinase
VKQTATASPEDPGFTPKIAEAERAEFRAQDHTQAAALYREAIALARTDTDRAAARIALARVLARSGDKPEAARIYRELLNLPSPLVDDQGHSFASSAAYGLTQLHIGEKEALDRVARDLEPGTPLTPSQAVRLRLVLDALQMSGNTAIRATAAAVAMERLAPRMQDFDRAAEVQESYRNLRVTTDAWRPLVTGSELWWIGKASTGASSRPLVLAVRVEEVRKSVEADWLLRQLGPSFQITFGGDGDPLGEALPGMRVSLGSEPPDPVAAAPDGPRSFYGISLFLVVILTFLGAFFLWRDTRRESRIAELRSQFVSSVSHELKTPLTSIRMFAESLQMDDEEGSGDPKERAEYLDTIVCETERLTRLLNNVLDFSRIERGQKNYRMESADLSSVVGAAVRTMRFPLAEQGFDLQVDLSEDIPPVSVDRDAIEQAVLNLLSNAMKYSGNSREIGLRLFRQNGSVLIQVSDHGVGIPAGEQLRIFEKFYRVSSKENRAISGTGLGLALVAHIVRAHEGRVEVESEPGQGSTFTIRLPLHVEEGSTGGSERPVGVHA